jgi:Tol biopolymer transport system component
MRRVAARVAAFAACLLAATGARAQTPASGVDERPAVTPTYEGEGASPRQEPPPGPAPDVRWFTLDTPHFHIHFYEDERLLAAHSAIIAERAHHLLTRYLNWRTAGRINITLNDQDDAANGFASSVPYNFVYGFGAVPGPLDELDDFDDYLKLLLTHELTHVVHLDTILGFARIYNALFGKLYAPNLSQPNWFVEGLAVLEESRQTTAGRLRSNLFQMELRMPFLEDRALGLDAISNGPIVFPGGTAAYLYGSSILKYVEDRYGPEKIREISHRYGGELIPGGINRIAARALGVGYLSLWGHGVWDDWRTSMGHKFALEEEDARRRGLTPARRLTHDAPGSRGDGFAPRFFADGTLVYARNNTDSAPAFVRLDPATGARRSLAEVYGAGHAVPTSDGQALVFHRTNYIPLRWRISGNSHATWNDIFRLDLATGELRELSRARRAEDPDVSPDGTQIACTLGGAGTRRLAILPAEGGVPRVVAADVPGLAYSPTWSPDGRLIAYSRWKRGGFRDIHLYDVAAGTDRALSVDRAIDADPRFSPDGRYLLFSSDRTGIYNIFARDLETGKLLQVTNVLGGAFQPAVSPDGKRLVYTGFTSAGFDLYETPFDPWTWQAAQPYANARLDAPTDPASIADSPDATPGEPPVEAGVEATNDYAPWKYMYPRSWIFEYQTDPLGVGNSGRVQFTVGDPAANHSVTVDVLVPANGDASLRVDYSYLRLWPAFSLTGTRTAALACDLVLDGQRTCYRQNSASGSASIGLPVLRRPESAADVSFGYTLVTYAPAARSTAPDPTGGILIEPETGPDASLFLQWSFANAHAWAYSISPQEGRRLVLTTQLHDPALGGKFHAADFTWLWTEYFTPPWARLHAFALLYSGGIGVGDKRAFFGLGGFVEQDLLRTLFRNTRQGGQFLRGYAPNAVVGDQFHLVSAEYRAPLLWFEGGYQTFPIYLRRLYGAAFTDVGNAFFGQLRPSDLRVGVGGELRLQLVLAYYIEAEIQLGVARGLTHGGADQLYLVTSFPF